MSSTNWAYLTSEQFAQALYALLPTGFAWTRDHDSNMAAFVNAVADIIAEVHSQAALLSEIESSPYLTSAMLSDWEMAYGLPDPCLQGIVQTTEVRRQNLVARVGDKGGQSIAHLLQIAAALGYVGTTISEYTMFKADHGKIGDPVPSEDWLFAWLVNVNQTISLQYFTADHSSAGDPLVYYSPTLLECVYAKIKPAQTHPIFAYHT